jgi:hypothetical protein
MPEMFRKRIEKNLAVGFQTGKDSEELMRITLMVPNLPQFTSLLVHTW